MHDGNLIVHGKNEEYTAKPASRAALVSFILRISLGSPRAALIETSPSTIEARTALATAPLCCSSSVAETAPAGAAPPAGFGGGCCGGLVARAIATGTKVATGGVEGW